MKKLFSTKKGQFGAMGAMMFLVVGVGVAVLVLILVGVMGGQVFQSTQAKLLTIGSNEVTGETRTAINGTEFGLTHRDVQEGTLLVVNSSGGNIPLTNFTFDFLNGKVTPVLVGNGSGGLNNTVLTFNYTWGADGIRNDIQSAVIAGFDAQKQTGEFLPIVVLGVITALVLALVLSFLPLVGGQGGFGGAAL